MTVPVPSVPSANSIMIWVVLIIVGSFIFSAALAFFIIRYVRKGMVQPMIEGMTGMTPQAPPPGTVSGWATILSAQLGGAMMKVMGQPPGQNITLTLEVHPPDGGPYQATTRVFAPIALAYQYQPGAQVTVAIDPANREKVTVTSVQSPQVAQIPTGGPGFPAQGPSGGQGVPPQAPPTGTGFPPQGPPGGQGSPPGGGATQG